MNDALNVADRTEFTEVHRKGQHKEKLCGHLFYFIKLGCEVIHSKNTNLPGLGGENSVNDNIM
jgi:hypothetical protein